jgi:chromosomal replication initiation ATPase DnaA
MNKDLTSKYKTPEDFRKLYDRIIADYRLEEYANSRRADTVCIRQAIMSIARENTNLTLKQIASIWNRHHSTVIHGLSNVKNAHETNDELYLEWELEIKRYF